MRKAPDGNLFGMILDGEIPSTKVFSNDLVYCFLDLYPQNPGHTLIIPRNYSENVLEASETDIVACLSAARRLIPAIQAATGAKGVSVLTNLGKEAGQMIEYLHFHLIPRHPGDEISYYKVGPEQTAQQLADMAEKIKTKL